VSIPPESEEKSSDVKSQTLIIMAGAELGKMAFFYTNNEDRRLSVEFGGASFKGY
jgi:hypothetical protein